MARKPAKQEKDLFGKETRKEETPEHVGRAICWNKKTAACSIKRTQGKN